jgi:hypothetical protein
MRDAAWGGADLSALMHHAINGGRLVTEGCTVRKRDALDKRVPMQCFA